MLPNIPAMLEAHFGVPMSGAVLNALNTRLDARRIAFMLEHGEAKVLLTDTRVRAGHRARRWRMLGREIAGDRRRRPRGDRAASGWARSSTRRSSPRATRTSRWLCPADEWDAIALNYTSGTTGNPKGVVYHHRGAYLNAVGNILDWGMPQHPVYLWTLPMFHCNGWCFPWTMAASAGTQRLPAPGRSRSRSSTLIARARRHALLRRADRACDAGQRARAEQRRRFDHKVQDDDRRRRRRPRR